MYGWIVGFELLAVWLEFILAALLAICFYGLFVSVSRARPGRHGMYLTYRSRGHRVWLNRILLLPGREHPRCVEKQRLLYSCGWRIDVLVYLAVSRIMIVLSGILLLLCSLSGMSVMLNHSDRLIAFVVAALVIAALLADKSILEKLQQVRRYKVIRDIDVLSRQLLYYSGVAGNLHGKLMRCLPFAGSIRSEWYQLTNEWYQSADMALRRFQERVATEEGRSFADTLNALRQYDHDRYYELLRQRIADYKEKLELHKESRKESFSYVLFVVAGVPILYTFRLFVYPWVEEGQKLFESLG